MKPLFSVSILVLAVSIPATFDQKDAGEPGGVWCNTNMVNVSCEGSYIGSAGCGASTIPSFSSSGMAMGVKGPKGAANCNTSNDTTGVGCAGNAADTATADCWPHRLKWPIF